jgi:hypothetical protein
MYRTLVLALAAATPLAACDSGAPAVTDSGPDILWDAQPPGDLAPQPDAQDPREALRQRSLVQNGSFEQTAADDALVAQAARPLSAPVNACPAGPRSAPRVRPGPRPWRR